MEIRHTGDRGSSYGYYEKGCNCPECTEAARIKNKLPKNREEGEVLTRGKPLPEHGTNARYRRGCKCDDCRAAHNHTHHFYADGTPKPPRGSAPAKKRERKAVQPGFVAPVRRKPPKVVVSKTVVKEAPKTYEPEPADICGLDLPNDKLCKRKLPCSIHDEGEM